jgi:8-oxo-dGTP pyrophosphatase MutT (NUDIX family)
MDITNRIQYCINCGQTGHVFRNCLSPVTSYGLIAVRYTNDTHQTSLFSKSTSIDNGNDSIQFLLIKRRHSIKYVEFIRGKYNPYDEDYIIRLLKSMTQEEHRLLLTKTFDELWNGLWRDAASLKIYQGDKDVSSRKFALIVEKLPGLITEYPSKWTEPEWGFPKGRRSPHETDLNCAIREFEEETDVKRNNFTVIHNTNPISETFFGSNQIHYCHKYYIAICNKSVEAELNINNYQMVKEIGDIQWLTLDEAIAKIRPDNVEKREVLLKAGKIMRNFYPIYTLDEHRISTNASKRYQKQPHIAY